ncbi:hypothetical protein OVS_04425 [Mycoplasma ovis str. Michigan]|uniref:Uncharacterized protein n=1 Tax=Mycoplasma ovis str. Michigan TaxID=1415773 RepID=A0ABN4BL35_9MOLU|nr:hypothetical protein OVS_04425 [Mycoplasma ovis str. Michigan]
MSLKEKDLDSFVEELISGWRSKKPDDESYYQKFASLSKEDLQNLIDLLIEEIEDIKGINKLIRLKESLSAVFDLKLLYNNLKSVILNTY